MCKASTPCLDFGFTFCPFVLHIFMICNCKYCFTKCSSDEDRLPLITIDTVIVM